MPQYILGTDLAPNRSSGRQSSRTTSIASTTTVTNGKLHDYGINDDNSNDIHAITQAFMKMADLSHQERGKKTFGESFKLLAKLLSETTARLNSNSTSNDTTTVTKDHLQQALTPLEEELSSRPKSSTYARARTGPAPMERSTRPSGTRPPVPDNLQARPSIPHPDEQHPNLFPIARAGLNIVPPPFQRPLCLLTFSFTPSHELVFDDSALKYFKPPPLNVPLDRDYDNWIKRPWGRGRLDPLLRCLARDEARAHAARAHAVMWRGVMCRLITAPYEPSPGWELNAMMINGTLYLEEHLTAEKLRKKEAQDRKCSYYGYAFQSYCRTPSPSTTSISEDGWGGPVNTDVQWCALVKSKMSNIRLLVGGEIDCIRGVLTGQPDNFVELHTSIVIQPGARGARQKFHRKLLRYWAQCYLFGVPELVIGFRTQNGTLVQTDTFRTPDIPGMVDPGREWNAARCLDFGARLLQFTREHIQRQQRGPQDEKRVWRLTLSPGTEVRIDEVSGPALDEVVNGEARIGFLPTEYVLSHLSQS